MDEPTADGTTAHRWTIDTGIAGRMTVAGIALMAPPTALRLMLVFPLAMHLGGCVGDWWILSVVLRLPAGVRIEDTEEGFRYRV